MYHYNLTTNKVFFFIFSCAEHLSKCDGIFYQNVYRLFSNARKTESIPEFEFEYNFRKPSLGDYLHVTFKL